MDLIQSYGDLARLLIRVTDNGGETADRYGFYFGTGAGAALCCSGAPGSPQGVSMYAEYDPATVDRNVRDGEARDVYLCEVPPHVVQHVINRTNEAYRDHVNARLVKAGLNRDEDDSMATVIAEGVRQSILGAEENYTRYGFCGSEFQRDVLGTDDGTAAVPVRIVDELIEEAESWYAGDRDPKVKRILNALKTLRDHPGALGYEYEEG